MNKAIMIILTAFYIMNINAVIVDSKGILLPEAISVFCEYKPLIEERMDDICSKYSLSKEDINKVFDPHTERETISLYILNAIAQTVFLRPAYVERKDTSNDLFLPYTTEKVMKLFAAMGDIENIYPAEKQPKYIILHGSTVQNMRFRIKTFVDFVEAQKIILTSDNLLTEIIFLTGDRDLFDIETAEVLYNPAPLLLNPAWQVPEELPKTEGEAARWIWNQSLFSDAIRNAKITFVLAEKKVIIDDDGNERVIRPTTADTVMKWIADHNPEPGHCVAISSQPYVYYQEVVMKGILKKNGMLDRGFSVEDTGISDILNFDMFKSKIAVILDNFARIIYTEMQNAQ